MIPSVCVQSLSPVPALAFPKVSEHTRETTLTLDSDYFLLPILRLTLSVLDICTYPHCSRKVMQDICRCTFILIAWDGTRSPCMIWFQVTFCDIFRVSSCKNEARSVGTNVTLSSPAESDCLYTVSSENQSYSSFGDGSITRMCLCWWTTVKNLFWQIFRK